MGGRGVKGTSWRKLSLKPSSQRSRGEPDDRGEGHVCTMAYVGLLCLRKKLKKEVDPTRSMVLLDEGQGGARLPGTLEGKVTKGRNRVTTWSDLLFGCNNHSGLVWTTHPRKISL